MPKMGKFIVLEGGEGAGKGVVMADLRQRLAGRDDVIFTREPGGTKIAEKIRTLLLSKGNEAMLPLTKLFLFCGARAQHVNELIKPALESGKNVISDRFSYSTVAYQIFGRVKGELFQICEQLNFIATGGLKPDAVIYFDVESGIGLERKAKSKDGHCTRFDKENFEFYAMARIGYLEQYRRYMEEKSNPVWHLIETTVTSEQEVKEKAWGIVKKILEMK